MSKKLKKRIAELERQQSILAATVRVMRAGQNWGKCICFIPSLLGTIPSKKEQGKTEQPQQTEAEKEQEKAEQNQPENHRENLGAPVLNKPKEDWESPKQISPK